MRKNIFTIALLILSLNLYSHEGGERTGNGSCTQKVTLLIQEENQNSHFIHSNSMEATLYKAIKHIHSIDPILAKKVFHSSVKLSKMLRPQSNYQRVSNGVPNGNKLSFLNDIFWETLPQVCRPANETKVSLIKLRTRWSRMDHNQKAYSLIHMSLQIHLDVQRAKELTITVLTEIPGEHNE